MKEVLWLGGAEVNESEAIGFLSECGKIELKRASEVAVEIMLADLFPSELPSRPYERIKRQIYSKVESFVLAKPNLAVDQGFQSSDVVESSFHVRQNDLFVAETDYQTSLAAAFVHPASEIEKPDWMPSQLHLLNVFAESYMALKSKRMGDDKLITAVSELEAGLAAKLGVSKLDSQKMVAAKRITEGDAIFYPRPPVKPLEGAKKVSLLDIANSLAQYFWKGEVEETKAEYGSIERFNSHLDDILRDNNVGHRASFLPHLSRFIRFT